MVYNKKKIKLMYSIILKLDLQRQTADLLKIVHGPLETMETSLQITTLTHFILNLYPKEMQIYTCNGERLPRA